MILHMAKRTNNIQFSKAAIEVHDDGAITITEVGKDTLETHDLKFWLESFSCDDLSKLVTLTIKEDTQVEGNVE